MNTTGSRQYVSSIKEMRDDEVKVTEEEEKSRIKAENFAIEYG